MTTCPNCNSRVGYLTILRTVLPVRITCSNCGARLEGDRLVQVAVLGVSLILGGSGAYVFLLLYLSPLLVFPPGSLLPPALVATLAWLIGASVIQSYGRYVEVDRDSGLPRALRLDLLGAGVLALAVVAWLVLYVGVSALGVGVWLTVALAILLILYARYQPRLGDRTGSAVAVMLLVSSGGMAVFALVLTVISAANFPKEPAFQEQLAFSPSPQSEYDAWRDLRVLLGDFENNHRERISAAAEFSSSDYEREDVKALLETTAQDRDAVLEFLADNVASTPEDELSLRSEPSRYIGLQSMQELELAEVRKLIASGDGPVAKEKYLRLWRVADNLVSGKDGLLKSLISMGLAEKLVEFYLDEDNRTVLSSDRELSAIPADIGGKLDDAMASSFTLEYLGQRWILFALAENPCLLGDYDGQTDCPRKLHWPILDLYKTLRFSHDPMADLVSRIRQPSYRVKRLPTPVPRETDELTVLGWHIKNPVGIALMAATIPNLGAFVGSGDKTKAKLLAFAFLLESSESGELGNPPIDPLTGEPFVVTRTGDTVVIASYVEGDGEPAVRYEISIR